jgi:proteasome lid subunit RPN8/RPN11
MHVLDTMFATSELEDEFRRYANKHSNVEIGGYFFAQYGPPDGISYRQWGKATGCNNAVVRINDWILAPNKSQNPANEFVWTNLDYLKSLVTLTGMSRNKGDWFNFHSHPKGSAAYPSKTDLTFAMTHCELYTNYYRFAIVQTYPLRVLIFDMQGTKQGNKATIAIESGHFWSWRENALKSLPYKG